MTDNILLATELVKGYNRKFNTPKCMLKVDLRNAYDSVDWRFLKRMLEELAFPPKFVEWIMCCISTVSYSPVVNGSPTTPFFAAKGLRQGDPISPYLFAIGMEYFSRLLNQLHDNPHFKYHPKCRKLRITQLLFADEFCSFAMGILIQ